MGKEPDKNLLRRREVIDWTGIKAGCFDKMSKTVLTRIYLGGKSRLPNGDRQRAFYSKEEVRKKLLAEHLDFGDEK